MKNPSWSSLHRWYNHRVVNPCAFTVASSVLCVLQRKDRKRRIYIGSRAARGARSVGKIRFRAKRWICRRRGSIITIAGRVWLSPPYRNPVSIAEEALLFSPKREKDISKRSVTHTKKKECFVLDYKILQLTKDKDTIF